MQKSLKFAFFSLVISFLALGSANVYAFGQSLPTQVKPSFDSKFVGAKVISYHEINGEHNIIFEQDSEVKSARFDANGNWIDTIVSLNPGTAPVKIKDYLTSNYAGKNGHVRRIENAEGTTYLVFISESKALRFDADGNMVKIEDVSSIDEAALSTIK